MTAGVRVCPACGLEVKAGITSCPKDGTNLVKALEDEPAFRGKYEFLGQIGSGGMGVIYKARQTSLNKLVAIKMLHPHIVSSDAFRRFQIEGKAVSLLQHAYIINVDDLATTESGQPYMVMDFVEGPTLAQVIEREGPLSIGRFLRIFDQICDALAHAHNRGVVHRDLKPSNIMLTRRDGEEEVRIMDFGIAKLIDAAADQQGSNQLTRTGEAIGSALYMSPEQTRGAKTDARSDLYSLGCVMYEALTGAPPLSGSTPVETMMMQLNDKPSSMSQSMLGKIEFPADLEAMIGRLLEKDADLRYQSMEELNADLGRLQSGKSLPRSVATAPAVARINWQLVSIALLAACIIVALVVAAYSALNRSTSTAQLVSPLVVPGEPAHPAGTEHSARTEIAALVAKRGRVLDLSGITREYEVRDDDIAQLANATDATAIDLSIAQIDDSGLKYISSLKLKKLNLHGTDVKDLDALNGMTTLESLDLERTAVTDEAMNVVAHLRGLKDLNIIRTGVSDTGLNYLSGLKNLGRLKVGDCSHITKDGLERLQKKLPACSIEESNTESSKTYSRIDWVRLSQETSPLMKKGQFKEAAARFADAANELKQESPPPLKLIAQCLRFQGQCLVGIGLTPANHKAALAEALKVLVEAEQTFEKIEPNEAAGETEKYTQLGQIYMLQAMILESTSDWRQASIVREKASKHSSNNDPATFDNLTNRGIDCVQLKEDNRALQLFSDAIAGYKRIGKADTLECVGATEGLAAIYFRQQRFKEALPLYEHAISIIRRVPDVWKRNGPDLMWVTAASYAHLGRNTDAEHLLKELLKFRPDRQDVYDLLIQALTAEHKQGEATNYANKLNTLKSQSKAKTQ